MAKISGTNPRRRRICDRGTRPTCAAHRVTRSTPSLARENTSPSTSRVTRATPAAATRTSLVTSITFLLPWGKCQATANLLLLQNSSTRRRSRVVAGTRSGETHKRRSQRDHVGRLPLGLRGGILVSYYFPGRRLIRHPTRVGGRRPAPAVCPDGGCRRMCWPQRTRQPCCDDRRAQS